MKLIPNRSFFLFLEVAILAYSLYEKLMQKMRAGNLKLKSKPNMIIKRGRRSTINQPQIGNNERRIRTLRTKFLRGMIKKSKAVLSFHRHPLKRKSISNDLRNQIKWEIGRTLMELKTGEKPRWKILKISHFWELLKFLYGRMVEDNLKTRKQGQYD